MNVSEILKWIRTVDVKSLPYNVCGIGWGPKIVNGQETDQYCLIFTVLIKRKKEELPLSQLVPSHFNIENNIVITDVQEAQIQSTLNSVPTYSVIASTSEAYEGTTVQFVVETINVTPQSTLYWTTSGSVNASDFTDFALSGTAIISNISPKSYTFFNRTLAANDGSDHNEQFLIQIRTGSELGPVVATSAPVFVYEPNLDCHVGPTSYNPPEPIASNRKKYRPLKGGISSITATGSDATLGLLVRDKSDGAIVALSNNHVYASTQVTTRTGYPTNSFGVGWANTNTLGLTAIQPALSSFNPYGRESAGSSAQFLSAGIQDLIGVCKRSVIIGNENNEEIFYKPLRSITGLPIINSTCDAAIVQLSSYNLLNSESVNISNFSQPGPFMFASDEEIDSLLDPSSLNYGSPIFRSGRTCGPIGFPGYTNSCALSVYQFTTELVGTYSNHLGLFSDSYRVRGNCIPGRGGDSGSAMLALLSSTVPSASAWKVIGLLFAGPGHSQYTIGCRITNIVKDLDIAPWDGTIPTLSSSRSILTLQNNFSPTVTLSGRKFYQVGYENPDNPSTNYIY